MALSNFLGVLANIGEIGAYVNSFAQGVGNVVATGKGLFGSSGGTSAYKTLLIDKYQRKRAYQYQTKYDKWYLNNITRALDINQPSWQRKGLETAGYNPVLAYMSQAPSPTAGSIGGSNANAVTGNDAMAGVSLLEALNNQKLVNAQTTKLKAETNNIENKPENLFIEGLKGLFGLGNSNSGDVAYNIGKLSKKYGLNAVTKLKQKIIDYTSKVKSISEQSAPTNAFKVGISNYDNAELGVHFTKEELDIIEQAESMSRNKKHYNRPPSTFPI